MIMDTNAVIVAFWFVCAIAGGIIGGSKNAGGLGFVLGLLLGPLGVIAAFALDGRPRCPDCATRLNTGARMCPFCGRNFAMPATSQITRDLPLPTLKDEEQERQAIERRRNQGRLPPRR